MPTRPKFSAAAAPVEKPLPLWILYPVFFVVLYLTHYKLLRLPYFWDEGGYYIPAALDFFRTGALVPYSTATNAHPPLPSILLAGWWHITGLNISATRTLVVMLAAAALLGIYRSARLLAGTPVAVAVVLLTATYPVWFAQSSLAHADIFAAAFTLWALPFYLQRFNPAFPTTPRTLAAIAVLFALAALSKETAIVTPVALALWEAVQYLTDRSKLRLNTIVALLAPILPLALWYVYHRHVAGFTFGNPEFLRYNATANLTPFRVLTSLWHRTTHLTVHMNMYVPLVCTAAVLFMPRRQDCPDALVAPATHLPALSAMAVVVVGNAVAFSILGGALLTRYLLPLYPLILLACVAVWRARLKAWPALAALTAAGFVSALFINPPYGFAPEDNLTYRDMIVLHQQAAAVIEKRYPYATVLSAWPGVAELDHPDLGYVTRPIKVAQIENFSVEQIEKAAQSPRDYDTAFIFSTKWTPPEGAVNLARASESTNTRFYDYHRDVTPAQAAAMLHGDIVWQASRNGEWAAILRFPRSTEAKAVGAPPFPVSSERVGYRLR